MCMPLPWHERRLEHIKKDRESGSKQHARVASGPERQKACGCCECVMRKDSSIAAQKRLRSAHLTGQIGFYLTFDM
jgi:hypothetical protein